MGNSSEFIEGFIFIEGIWQDHDHRGEGPNDYECSEMASGIEGTSE